MTKMTNLKGFSEGKSLLLGFLVEYKPASRLVASEPDFKDQNAHMHTHTHS